MSRQSLSDARDRILNLSDAYFVRLDGNLSNAERQRILRNITTELADQQGDVSACAEALLTYAASADRGTVQRLERLAQEKAGSNHQQETNRLLAAITVKCGKKLVEHYHWADLGRQTLRLLRDVVVCYPSWPMAVQRLNAVMLHRHIHSVMYLGSTCKIGEHSGASASKRRDSPLVTQDLGLVKRWAHEGAVIANDGVKLIDDGPSTPIPQTTLDDIAYWVSMDKDCLDQLQVVTAAEKAAIQLSSMLGKDKFGLLVPREFELTPAKRKLEWMELMARKKVVCEQNPATSLILPPKSQENSGQQRQISQSIGAASLSHKQHTQRIATRSSVARSAFQNSGSIDSTTSLAALPSKPTLFSQTLDNSAESATPPVRPAVSGKQPKLTLPTNEPTSVEESVSTPARSPILPSDVPSDEDSEEMPTSLSASPSFATLPEQCRLRSPGCPICEGDGCDAGYVPAEFTGAAARSQIFEQIHKAHKMMRSQKDMHLNGHIEEAWLGHIHMATIYYEPASLGSSSCSKSDAEVWCLDHTTFRNYADSSEVLDRPILIIEPFKDGADFTMERCAKDLFYSLKERRLGVRDPYTGGTLQMTGSDIRNQLAEPQQAYNVLDLAALADAERPTFTRLQRFRLLKMLVDRVRPPGKIVKEQAGNQPFDVGGCHLFDILGFAGAFSGAHVDALVGTWVRTLFGTKVWMFIPPGTLSKADKRDLARDGDLWNPSGKARAIFLEKNHVFFMPPGPPIVHSVFTLETSLMEGGMVWDFFSIIPTLETLYWIGRSQATTNEAFPYQMFAILEELQQVVETEPSLFVPTGRSQDAFMAEFAQCMQALNSLACQCRGQCKEDCGCFIDGRRCTGRCAGHPHLPGKVRSKCMNDIGGR